MSNIIFLTWTGSVTSYPKYLVRPNTHKVLEDTKYCSYSGFDFYGNTQIIGTWTYLALLVG